MARSGEYLFSVLIAVYNVREYLPAFLASLDNQKIEAHKVQYIFVDDRSTDDSLEILRAWAATKPHAVIDQTPQNGGPAAARNLALTHAQGEWVTAADPDDVLDAHYFSSVERFLTNDDGAESHLLATRVYITNDRDGARRDIHPLGYKFRSGDRKLDLDEDPYAFQLGATAFMKLALIREHGLRYDERVRPSFEDANLICRYLLLEPKPVIGLVSSAHYYYRKRVNQSSLVQSGWARPEKYDDQIRYGYLPLARDASADGAKPLPRWLENVILYDLFWYFTEDAKYQASTAWASSTPSVANLFLELVAELLGYVSYEAVAEFSVQWIQWEVREALLAYFYQERTGGATIYRDAPDLDRYAARELQPGYERLLVVTAEGELSPLALQSSGQDREYELVDAHATYLFGRALAYHWVVEVPADWDRADFGGREVAERDVQLRPLEVIFSQQHLMGGAPRLADSRNKFQRRFDDQRERIVAAALVRDTSVAEELRSKSKRVAKRLAKRVARKDPLRKLQRGRGDQAPSRELERFAGAWLILDRPDSAGDNGEHLYRYILREHPEVQAYFVLRRSSADWQRLEAEGFRLLDSDGPLVEAAYKKCAMVASSDAVSPVMYLSSRVKYGEEVRPFVFLQHGASTHDISHWINPKPISAIITCTEPEYVSMTDPRSPYVIPRDSVLPTGFPRHDRLMQLRRELAGQLGSAERTVLIVPSWRVYLKDALERAKSDAERAHVVADSAYFKAWKELLTSPDFREFLARERAQVQFVLHPSLAPFATDLQFDDQVRSVTMQEIDFQRALASASAFVTDFSSTVYDAAYMGVPSVYYTFDYEEMMRGKHSVRKGWWFDLERDGVGPTSASSAGVITALQTIAANGWQISEEYEARTNLLFSRRDEHNSERTFQALAELFPPSLG